MLNDNNFKCGNCWSNLKNCRICGYINYCYRCRSCNNALCGSENYQNINIPQSFTTFHEENNYTPDTMEIIDYGNINQQNYYGGNCKISNIYIIDMENRYGEFFNANDQHFYTNSLYLGFKRYQSRIPNKLLNNWYESNIHDDHIHQATWISNNKLIINDDGRVIDKKCPKEFVDHRITFYTHILTKSIKNHGFVGTIYLVSSDNSIYNTMHCLKESLKRENITRVNVEIMKTFFNYN